MTENKDIKRFIVNQINETQFLINELLFYKNQKFNPRFEFNEIKQHIDDFLEEDTVNRFITLLGLRCVGKSTILLEIYDYLFNEKILILNIYFIFHVNS